jgi:hypothetical protein
MPQSLADRGGWESTGLAPCEAPARTLQVPRSILILLDANRGTDPAVLARATLRAGSTGAHLTMLCVWRRTRLLVLAPLADVDPATLLCAHERVVREWFRARIEEVPGNIGLRTLLREGRAADQVLRELRNRDYDELIVDRPLPRHALARLTRIAPEMNVIVL